MNRKKKDVIINGRPFNSRIRRHEGGFEWSFWIHNKLTGNRMKIINLRFDRWWLVYLAKDIKKVLDEEQTEMERLKDLSGFK